VAGTMTILAMLSAAEAGAQEEMQGLRLGAWAGEVEMGYAGDRQQTRSDGEPVNDFTHRRLSERLGIRNQGFSVLDPRLVTGNLGLSFGLFRDRDSFDGTETSRRGTLTGYAFDSTFLADKPYNATVYANRNQNSLTQPFGGRTDVDYENRGVALRLREDSILRDWGMPYFNSTLRAYQEHVRETTTGLGQVFERDELRNVIAFDGHKGFETADLDLRYELNDLDNVAFPAGSFRTQTGNVNYSQDFGPGLNRRWDSRLFYSDRTGLSPTTLVTADERVRIDHYKNLFTDYRYLGTRIETEAGTTDTHEGIFHVQHQLYRNLTSNARLSALHQDLPTGTRTSRAGQLDFSYQRSLPWDGRVFAHLGGRRQIDETRASASQINVVDEPHAAPAPLGGGAGFLLDQAFVVVATIVVVDTQGGGRVTASPGVDYDVLQEGNLTRIVPLPSSFKIQAGDPLAVSYTYEFDPSIKYSTDSAWLNAGADFRWIAFSVGHEQSDQTLLSGEAGRFLEDRRKDTAQLDLRGFWATLQGQASAAFTRYDSTRLAYTQQRFNQRVAYRALPNVLLALNAEESSTDYTLPERQSRSHSLGLTLDWLAPGGWSTTTFVGRRVYRDSVLPMETIDEASFRARWVYGKLEIVSLVALNDRTRGTFETIDRRFDLKLIRRF
jgi:hypothetical protein